MRLSLRAWQGYKRAFVSSSCVSLFVWLKTNNLTHPVISGSLEPRGQGCLPDCYDPATISTEVVHIYLTLAIPVRVAVRRPHPCTRRLLFRSFTLQFQEETFISKCCLLGQLFDFLTAPNCLLMTTLRSLLPLQSLSHQTIKYLCILYLY